MLINAARIESGASQTDKQGQVKSAYRPGTSVNQYAALNVEIGGSLPRPQFDPATEPAESKSNDRLDIQHETGEQVGGYNNWCAIAAFFDGDGSVAATIKKDTIGIKLEFSDNWYPQIAQIKFFLESHGIRTSKIFLAISSAYLVYVSSIEGVVAAARAMLRTGCIYKKKNELGWGIDYLEDRITGTKFIEKLNSSVRAKNRAGKIRHADAPYYHSEGSRQRYVRSAARRRLLTEEQKREIVNERSVRKMTYVELASKYSVSITTVARVLGKRRS